MPNLIPCKSCGHRIARSAVTCPHCGRKRDNWAVWGLFIFAIFWIVVAILKEIK